MAELFHGGPTEEPVAVVDFVNDQTGLEDNRVRDHGIVERIGVFGNVEVFLDFTRRVGEERPVGADPAAVLIRLRDVVGADRDQPAVADLEFAVELDQPFRLPAVLGAEAPAAEDEDQRVLSLQLGEPAMLRLAIRDGR